MKKYTAEIKQNPIYLLFAFLPSFPRILPLIILVCVGLSIKTNGINTIIRNIGKNKILLAISLFYLLHIFSALLSDNLEKGIQNLETKLSFLALPFIFAGNNSLKSFDIYRAIFYMLLATVVAYFFLELRAIIIYFTELYDRNHGILRPYYYYTDIFYTSYFCPYLHHTYFGMYISFMLCALIWNNNEAKKKITGNVNPNIFICILTALQFQLLSKAALAITVVILFLYLTMLFRKSQSKVQVIFITLTALGIFYYFFSDKVKSNIGYVSNVIFQNFNVADKSTTESSEVRTLVWKTASSLLSENWLTGVGVGDTEDVLVKAYQQNGITGAAEKKLNCHNQILQTWLANGILGIVLLIILLALSLYFCIQNKLTYLTITMFIIIFNMMFESILEVQAGTIFFSVICCLITFQSNIKKHHQPDLR